MTEIERFQFEKIPLSRPRQIEGRVADTAMIAHDTLRIAFEPRSEAMFDFVPGQYLSLVLQADEEQGLRRELRPYSLWSHPAEGGPAVTVVRLIEGGRASSLLRSLEPGDDVDFVAPLGSFYLRRPLHPHLHFVATGTGLVPLRSMLLEMADKGELEGRETTLWFGVRHEADLFAMDELRDLESRFSGFRFVPTLSQPGPEWTGATGRVTDHLRDATFPIETMQVYLCGNGAMIDEVVTIFEALGLHRQTRRIVYEKYFD
ncbi:MAG: hypothetical protein CL928_03755 [Deltaproteobacteria bacterium]|nr:hypothetical protein [Deltaproteobacteria bacterium]